MLCSNSRKHASAAPSQQAGMVLEIARLCQQASRDGEKRKVWYEASRHIVAALSPEKSIRLSVERLSNA